MVSLSSLKSPIRVIHRRNAYVPPIETKLAGSQPKDFNVWTFGPNAGNMRPTKKKTEILVFLGISAQNTCSIIFHVINNRYTTLDWKLKK